MALRKVAQAFRFAGGIETKQDAKAVPAVKLLNLENGVFTKAISIVKRNGYQDLGASIAGSASPLSGATRLGSRDDELIAFTANRSYSYDPEADQWADAGTAYSVVATDAPAVRTGTHQTSPDCATLSGVTAYAWEDSRGGVWWSSVSSSTGRVYRAPEQLDASGTRPRVCACGQSIHVYWASTSQIKCAIVNPSAPTAAPIQTVITADLDTTAGAYDAETTTYAGSPVLMSWIELGAADVRIAFIHPSGAIGGPVTALPNSYRESTLPVVGRSVAISSWKGGGAARIAMITGVTSGFGNEMHVFYYSLVASGGVTSLSLISHARATTIQVSTEGAGTTRMTCVLMDSVDAVTNEHPVWMTWERPGAAASQNGCKVDVYNTTAAPMVMKGVSLASRGFLVGGEPFATFVHDTTYFNTYFTRRLSDGFVNGRLLAALAFGTPTRSVVPSVQVTSNVATLCLPYKERLISENNDKFTETGIRSLSLDFNSDASHQSAQLGRGLYMAGACPMHYDGHTWTEQGFHVGPELIVATPDASGGAMTTALTYEYLAWYEWTDGQGEVHLGPTSAGTTVVMTGGATEVALTLPTLRITGKTNVRICVARSVGNDGSALFRVTSADPSTAGTANGYLANDPTVDTVTFLDQMSDATLKTEEPLYTNGGVLSNDPTSLGAAIAVGKNRLFFSDSSDQNVIHYSQEFDVGYGAEIPPELTVRCAPYGGAITALGVMDDQVIIFKEHALYVFGGDGPLANGDSSQTGFSAPQLITSDVGCTDPQSIAITPVGLMFKSAKGIYQIDRSKSVSYVGAAVEAFNAQTVRRATLMQDRTQVVFLTDSGKTLLYDYVFGQWSTFTNHAGYDAQMVSGLYHYLRTDGRIFRETPGVYTDGTTPIVLRFETAWIKFADYLQGFSRFYHLLLAGEYKTPHQLVVQVATDYSPHWSDPAFLDATNSASSTGWITGGQAAAIGVEPIGGTNYGDDPYGNDPYGGTAPPLYQWRMHLGIVGQAIRFRFEDFQSASQAGASFELSEMLVTGGAKGPARKPFSAARST